MITRKPAFDGGGAPGFSSLVPRGCLIQSRQHHTCVQAGFKSAKKLLVQLTKRRRDFTPVRRLNSGWTMDMSAVVTHVGYLSPAIGDTQIGSTAVWSLTCWRAPSADGRGVDSQNKASLIPGSESCSIQASACAAAELFKLFAKVFSLTWKRSRTCCSSPQMSAPSSIM